MEPAIDVVTVFHRDENRQQAFQLELALGKHELVLPFRFIAVDNRIDNRGFGKGCNHGAWQGNAPIIAFLNPDVEIDGPIFVKVVMAFEDDHDIVITGENFGKSPREYTRHWGCDDWVCGAAMFVRRDFFTSVGGFDERFIWGWEETDLIRRAQDQGQRTRSINLPIRHASPVHNPPEDVVYKNQHFDRGARLFRSKWKKPQ